MLNRQKIVLSLIERSGGVASRLRLTKLSFLLSQESPSRGGNAFYGFVPYRYGPYSFSLHRETGSLVRDGLLRETEEGFWELTPAAYRAAPAPPTSFQRDAHLVVDGSEHLSTRELSASIYERYPWFTVNSDQVSRRAQERPEAAPAVYTMGYEGLSVEGFLNGLMVEGVRRVLDVRSNPISRRYGFHKSTLSRLCRSLGIEYLHYPELGIGVEERRGLKGPEDYAPLFDRYRDEMESRRGSILRDLAGTLQEKAGALVCMEADPASCHRSLLAEAVAPLSGLPVTHLGWPR